LSKKCFWETCDFKIMIFFSMLLDFFLSFSVIYWTIWSGILRVSNLFSVEMRPVAGLSSFWLALKSNSLILFLTWLTTCCAGLLLLLGLPVPFQHQFWICLTSKMSLLTLQNNNIYQFKFNIICIEITRLCYVFPYFETKGSA